MSRRLVDFAMRGILATGVVLLATSVAQAQQKQKAAAQPASAASPGGGQSFLLGTFGDWKALMSGKDKSKLCYVLAQPKDRKPRKP